MTRAGHALRTAYLVASIAGVAFFVMSVSLLGVWPRQVLERQARAMSPDRPLQLTASEERGRAVYGREGCAYCHTQQIRYVHADMRRFGAPTLAWETRFDYPHLWGTRRIGPDLARTGSTRSDDWHFAHLFAPRSVVTHSVMPSYRWLFDEAPDRPTQEARDLVAYLQTLGRARELAGPEGERRARDRCHCPDDEMAQMAFEGPLNASPSRARTGPAVPSLPEMEDDNRGMRLYADNCASCHGPRGAGNGPGAASLLPTPSDLSAHEYTTPRLAEALWNGVAGTAMPAWRDHSLGDLAAIARFVRSLGPTGEAAVPASFDAALGAQVYAANCVQCHGLDGAGDGFAAAELSIAPTSFRTQRPSLSRSLSAVREGIRGTRMAAWTGRLSEAEIVAGSAYVRGFFQSEAAR